MKRTDKQKRWILIKDVPYLYIEEIFEGELDSIIDSINRIKKNLKEAHDLRRKIRPAEIFTPFEMYERISIEKDYVMDGYDYCLKVERLETDEEVKKRLKDDKNWIKSRKEAQEKKERDLYENLKKKFEGK